MIHSRPDMMTTIYHASPIYRNRLYQLLNKFVVRYRISNMSSIYKQIEEGSDDSIIIKMLQTNTPSQQQLAMDSTKRGDRAAEDLFHVLESINNKYSITSYLDIGCNNGSITVPFGEKLSLDSNHIHGIDVVNFGAQTIKPFEGFDYKQYDGYNIPFEDESFDLLTCLMVLHHVERPADLIKEFNRVMRKSSIIIIKEHNSYDPLLDNLIELEHMLYETIERNVSYEKFKEDYYQGLFDKDQLNQLMSDCGFSRLKIDSDFLVRKYYGYNPTKGYYTAFRKN